jgi:hypothetical protein
VSILYGGRSPSELLYVHELERWRGRFDVDVADADWHGRVGVVPRLIPQAVFDPERVVAMMCGPEVMMRFAATALQDRGVGDDRIWLSLERSMACAAGHCGHCQLGPLFICKDGPVLRRDVVEPLMRVAELFSLLDCEDELLALAGALDIAYFTEAGAERVEGDYDLSIVEGSITTAHDAERIREIRARSRRLICIGACATAGGIQALRNFADVEDFVSVVYASP